MGHRQTAAKLILLFAAAVALGCNEHSKKRASRAKKPQLEKAAEDRDTADPKAPKARKLQLTQHFGPLSAPYVERFTSDSEVAAFSLGDLPTNRTLNETVGCFHQTFHTIKEQTLEARVRAHYPDAVLNYTKHVEYVAAPKGADSVRVEARQSERELLAWEIRFFAKDDGIADSVTQYVVGQPIPEALADYACLEGGKSGRDSKQTGWFQMESGKKVPATRTVTTYRGRLVCQPKTGSRREKKVFENVVFTTVRVVSPDLPEVTRPCQLGGTVLLHSEARLPDGKVLSLFHYEYLNSEIQ